jgi:hypothetical protein
MQASVERQDALPAIRRTAALGPVRPPVPVHEPELEILCQRHHLAKLARRRPRGTPFPAQLQRGSERAQRDSASSNGGSSSRSRGPANPAFPARGATGSPRACWSVAGLRRPRGMVWKPWAGLKRHYGRPPASRLFTRLRTRRVTQRSWRPLRTTGALAGIELGGKIAELRITADQRGGPKGSFVEPPLSGHSGRYCRSGQRSGQ